jgi:small-conductance mechanosensitive channel
MILLDAKVPATLARLVALWLILLGIGGGFVTSVAFADVAHDAAAHVETAETRGAETRTAETAARASAHTAASPAPVAPAAPVAPIGTVATSGSAAQPSPLPATGPGDNAENGAGSPATGSPATGNAAPNGVGSTVDEGGHGAANVPAASAAPTSVPATSSSARTAPAASSGAQAANGEAVVKLHDSAVFTIRAPLGGITAEVRARAAGQTLERLVEAPDPPEIHTEEHAERIVIFGGTTPIVQLGVDDAIAHGDESLAVHAAGVAAKIRDSLQSERQRKAIAETVFSISLFAFSALIAILLLGQVRNLASKFVAWMEKNPDRLPALRFHGIDLVRPAAFRGGLSLALSAGRILSQLGIAYGWLLFASSLFESTRTYTERLTGFVLTPLSALIGRVGSSLPVLVILAAAVLITVLVVRFVGLFFGSVARGETSIGSLPRDLALPTGALVRFGIVVVALLVAAPLITGNEEGALSRAGVATLIALGLASAPVLASVVAGIPAIYGRRVRVGDHVEIAGRTGRVLSITLLEVRLEDDLGCHVRVPHLTSLWSPTRVIGTSPVAIVDLVADPQAAQSHVRAVLLAEARRFGTNVKVDLVRLDAEGAHYRVAARAPASHADDDLATALAAALAREDVALGRSASRRP